MRKTIADLSPETQEILKRCFTDIEGDVFFFTSEVPPAHAAAIMAMTSRQVGDIRYNYGRFMLESETPPEERAKRIVGFGDDSVAQLVTAQGGAERISNLATKKIESPREGDYIEQSTRYIPYNTRNEQGKYPYFTPPELSPNDAVRYETVMDSIFDLYSEALALTNSHLQNVLTNSDGLPVSEWDKALTAQACDAVRMMLPASTSSNVGFQFSAQGIENLVLQLESDRLEEMRTLGKNILKQARLIMPEFLERVDVADRGVETKLHRIATRDTMTEIVTRLGLRPSEQRVFDGTHVRMIDYWPHNELDIVAGLLMSEAKVSYAEVQAVVQGLTDEEKLKILRAYVGERNNRRHKPGRAMELPHYRWEIVEDYGSFRDLQRHRKIDAVEWQETSPHYGRIETPDVVVQAGVQKLIEEAFAHSVKLYDSLNASYGSQVAQYATLFGHHIRWTFMENAREAFHLHELRTQPAGHPAYRSIVQEMHRQVAKVHPELAALMNYVNFDENPTVTRLAEALRNEAKRRKLGYQ